MKQAIELKKEPNILFSSDEPDTSLFVQELISLIEILGNFDVTKASKGLKSLNIALEWDANFTLKLMSLQFPELDGVSFTNIKKLLKEIESSI